MEIGFSHTNLSVALASILVIGLLSVSAVPPAFATASTIVQYDSSSCQKCLTLGATFASSVGYDDVLVATLETYSSIASPAISDTLGLVWHQVGSVQSNAGSAVFYARTIHSAGPDTITWTWPQNLKTYAKMDIYELTNAGDPTYTSATGSAASIASGPLTLSVGDVVIGSIGITAGTVSAGAGFALTDLSSNQDGGSAEQSTAVTTTTTCPASQSGKFKWAELCVQFPYSVLSAGGSISSNAALGPTFGGGSTEKSPYSLAASPSLSQVLKSGSDSLVGLVSSMGWRAFIHWTAPVSLTVTGAALQKIGIDPRVGLGFFDSVRQGLAGFVTAHALPLISSVGQRIAIAQAATVTLLSKLLNGLESGATDALPFTSYVGQRISIAQGAAFTLLSGLLDGLKSGASAPIGFVSSTLAMQLSAAVHSFGNSAPNGAPTLAAPVIAAGSLSVAALLASFYLIPRLGFRRQSKG